MNFGQNLYNWLMAEFGWVFLIIIVGLAILYFLQRKFSKLIGLAVVAGFVSLFVYQPKWITNTFSGIAKMIFG